MLKLFARRRAIAHSPISTFTLEEVRHILEENRRLREAREAVLRENSRLKHELDAAIEYTKAKVAEAYQQGVAAARADRCTHDHRDIGWTWAWVKRCACGHQVLTPDAKGPIAVTWRGGR